MQRRRYYPKYFEFICNRDRCWRINGNGTIRNGDLQWDVVAREALEDLVPPEEATVERFLDVLKQRWKDRETFKAKKKQLVFLRRDLDNLI